ncbi:putative RNA-directed DNA polymerase, partial [Tanacetum coccineum]
MVTGVPSQEGTEGNVAGKKKVMESMKANLGKLLKYNAWSTRWSPIRGLFLLFIHASTDGRGILKIEIWVADPDSLAVALDGTLCLVDRDRLRPIIVDELSKWETVGISVQLLISHPTQASLYSQFLGWKDSPVQIIWTGCETLEEIKAHQKHYDDANKVSCIMAASMSPELQKTFKNTWTYEINQQLKEMFQAKASKERLDVVKSLMAYKPKPGASICAFVLEMKGYFDRLESLNMAFDAELSINMIQSGLPADYNQFVLSYQMNKKETLILELHNLLQTIEQGIEKSDVPSTSVAPVLNVGHNAKKRKTSHSNWKGKATQGKSDRGSKRKHSCPKYLKDLKDKKVKKGDYSGMFMMELHNTTTSDLWVLDTGCGTHIFTVFYGLKESRKLKNGELNLVMGNRKITLVTKIGKYELMLKSRVRINLNNCCYSSEMTRNIISFHALFKDGYQFSFDNENGDILVYSNGCFVFKVSPCKGKYETAECIENGNVILNVGSSNELDKSKLWHSCLGRVNKKRIAQLQKDRVLESFDFKLDDVCESCLLGRMTKSPFIGSCERGEGLLDLVHTDVCGPFRSATIDGKHYYVTFTNDFNRYGYVYLIKHKSYTFEVFKKYQNEVENQLGRKIK